MATLINNARIVEQVYEFGVFYPERGPDGKYEWYDNYDTAKRNANATGGNLKMRCVYYTEWMDAS